MAGLGRYHGMILLAAAFRAAALIPASADLSPRSYRVGHEDVVTVAVARHPEFSGDFYVPADGTVAFHSVGQLVLSGKTLDEIATELTSGLSARLRKPEVIVTLKTPRMQRVYVLGAVERPGLYDLRPGWRITEAMAAAGGVMPGTEPSDCSAVVLRATDGKRESVRLTDVLRGDPQSNAQVFSGDVITIEAQETLPVYVTGRVKSPGLHRLRKDTAGLMEAVTLAGGTLDDAALDLITVTHLNGKSETVSLLSSIRDGKPDQTVTLAAGDLVVVPEDTSRIAVLGFVRDPGFFPLRNGRKTVLSDALGLAKGVDRRGNMGSIAVISNKDGTQTRRLYDMHKFLRNGDVASNPEIRAGDVVYVPGSGAPDWDTVLRSLSAVGLLLAPIVP